MSASLTKPNRNSALGVHASLYERPRDDHDAGQANGKRGGHCQGPLPSMKRHCAFRDKSPRGEAASWECVHFKTRPRHAPAPSRMLASIKGVGRTGRNAVERRRGVTIGTDCIVRHFCHWSSCPGGMMCSSASTLAAERRRIDRMRKNGSLKGKDALSMRRGTRS